MILHEYYFENLRRAADPRPGNGSGLGLPGDRRNARDRLSHPLRGSDDDQVGPITGSRSHQEGIPAGFKPLRDYKATEKKQYVEAFFRNIDWRVVERRLGAEAAVRPAA